MLSYVELKQIVKPFYCPLVWHLEENCKTRELRIWKPRKDLNIVIGINVELFMKLIERYELIYFMDCILACLVLYIYMTCCR